MGVIQYVGGLRNNAGQTKVSRSKSGNVILDVLVAEQHRGKNSSVDDEFKDPSKGPEDWVNTTTSWHKVRVMGEAAERLAKDPRFNHGALVTICATYTEDKPWKDKGDVLRAGRPETVFSERKENDQWIELHSHDGKVFGAKPEYAVALWDGVSELPATGGSGSGGAVVPEYENEGF